MRSFRTILVNGIVSLSPAIAYSERFRRTVLSPLSLQSPIPNAYGERFCPRSYADLFRRELGA